MKGTKKGDIHERIICSVPSTARYLEKQRLQSSFLVTYLHAVLSPVWQDAVWIAAAQQAENETGVC
jgi:hypothetical protein